ncbi:MAG: 3-isopropylmalate/(R)-2-methylmalate dehydratase large subunit [Candidatus Methanomethylophilaceae archaeon]|nr:3-isopropylmalate/(R)-2-methylmalate dehydratase large subunit [Candidatus Methanomethylophilaceae archaeon]MDI3541435.1 3-isopropylmalate/(R)-2-methylmalate dehydratase large subunit [Candidatus Methanomethylophilaceae archaeon]
MSGRTFAQKVLSRASGTEAEVGDTVVATVDLAMSHENAALVSRIFHEIGAPAVWDPEKIVLVFDHRIPASTISAAEGHKTVREFAEKKGIINFYRHGEGICHQVLPEKGHVRPGALIVGSDSHTSTYGAFGAFATGIGATEMAAVWATGELWFRVPETLRIINEGVLPPYTMSKDLMLRIIGDIGADGANYRCVEYVGEAVDEMTISSRMVLCNMAIEMGAKAGVCFPDQKTRDYLAARSVSLDGELFSDEDAEMSHCELDVSDLVPLVAAPHSVDNVCSAESLSDMTVDQAVLGSCTNGRLEDLHAAASLLDGKSISPSVRLIVVPASKEVYRMAMEDGTLATLADAGGIVVNPGCGPCLGAHQGLLASGERAIATTNRNFRGRMGSPEAEIYLASPLTVAASALRGRITDPRELMS